MVPVLIIVTVFEDDDRKKQAIELAIVPAAKTWNLIRSGGRPPCCWFAVDYFESICQNYPGLTGCVYFAPLACWLETSTFFSNRKSCMWNIPGRNKTFSNLKI
jgi:hypothetical protein